MLPPNIYKISRFPASKPIIKGDLPSFDLIFTLAPDESNSLITLNSSYS
jgi:hypothetical protein